MKVVALFRVSTEVQADEGASLEAQERIYRELAAKSGWVTVAEFKGCESATQAASDRRVLQQVLGCVRDTPVDAVYVHEQSRLTRGDELEVAMLMRELKERRLKVIINGVIRDLNSLDERFMMSIQSAVDRAESERIKERLMRGKDQRGRQGKKNAGKGTYGYRNAPPGSSNRGVLQIVPEEAVVVRRIFEMRAAGHSMHAVFKDLQARGVPTPRKGCKWGKTTIARILGNPAYIGTHETNVWVARKGSRYFRYLPNNPRAIRVPNAHEPIIDRETWNAVQNRPRIPRAAEPRLLTGLLYINNLLAHGDSDGRMKFYRPPRGLKGLAWLSTEQTDEQVWGAFTALATGEDFVRRLMTEASKPKDRHIIEMEVEYLEGEISKQNKRSANLVDMRADGEIDKDEFRRRNDAAQDAIRKLQTELTAQKAKLSALDGAKAPLVVKAVQTLLAGRTKLTREQRRRILDTIVRRIDVEAVRCPQPFKRDAKGLIVPGRAPQWAISAIRFQLALSDTPVALPPPIERVPQTGPTSGGYGANGAGSASVEEPALGVLRPGQKDLAL